MTDNEKDRIVDSANQNDDAVVVKQSLEDDFQPLGSAAFAIHRYGV